MDSDEYGCPRCKTTKYRNPLLKLLVNTCGHPICVSCMEMLFVKGSGPCPDCGILLRRAQFREQLFDDPFVEREVDIRRRILKDYCKTEEDFATLREYNDYLEEIEHIIFNLVKNIDLVETNRKIEQYKKENADQIKRTRILGNPHIHELDEILREEELLIQKRNFENTVLEKEEQIRRMRTKESLIDTLMLSDIDAEALINEHKLKLEEEEIRNQALMEAKKVEFLAQAAANTKITTTSTIPAPGKFSTGLAFGSASSKAPMIIPTKEELFVYEDISYHHPNVPPLEDVLQKKYTTSYRETSQEEVAGGYNLAKSIHRGLLEIFTPIYIAFDPEEEGVNDEVTTEDEENPRMDTS